MSGYPHGDVATIGENLARIRDGRDQGKIAEKLQVSQTQLSNWERSRYENIKLKTLLRLAWGYGCTVEDLVVGLDAQYDHSRQYKPVPPPAEQPAIASIEANEILSQMEGEELELAINVLRRLHLGAQRAKRGVAHPPGRTARRRR